MPLRIGRACSTGLLGVSAAADVSAVEAAPLAEAAASGAVRVGASASADAVCATLITLVALGVPIPVAKVTSTVDAVAKGPADVAFVAVIAPIGSIVAPIRSVVAPVGSIVIAALILALVSVVFPVGLVRV